LTDSIGAPLGGIRQLFKGLLPLGVEAEVYVWLLLEVEECDLVLQVTDFVANRNAISGSENGVREDFAEKRDFV